MEVIVYSTKHYDRQFLGAAAADSGVALHFIDTRLTPATAELAGGASVVCAFVNDDLSRATLERLARAGVRLIALRCAGFNNVDVRAAAEFGIRVARVPAYSPHSVAEHTLALLLTLDRKTHRAFNRVREGNFSLDGLLGTELRGKTVGVVGTGKIGEAVVGILAGFGCKLLATDPVENAACTALGARYVSWEELCTAADIITLHCPLTPETHHLVDAAALARMRRGATLINTSRGAVVDTAAVIRALKSGSLGGLAIDVYEEESDLFFEDLSSRLIDDDVFARLLTFPNVLITGHQAFFTREAMTEIAQTTIANIVAMERTGRPIHEVTDVQIARAAR